VLALLAGGFRAVEQSAASSFSRRYNVGGVKRGHRIEVFRGKGG
jgi:hypothetical protein